MTTRGARRDPRPRTAFVLAGGGSLGAVQAGMLQALTAAGITPDLLVGTSVGAVNGAWVAGNGSSEDSLAELADVWTGLHRRDIFPVTPAGLLAGLIGGRNAISSSTGLARLVRRRAGIDDLADARVPLHVVATDVLSGKPVFVSEGSVVDAVLASAAIPGVFPPVRIKGRYLLDGGISHVSGIQHARGLGASVIYVLPTGYACALHEPPRSAVGIALHALTLLMQQQLISEVADGAHGAVVKVLPPLCPLAVSAADFSHAAELIDRGRSATASWLSTGAVDAPHPERFLALHRHEPGAGSKPRRPRTVA